MPWVFLLVSLTGVWLTYNVHRPMFAPSRRAALSFFAGWLTSELALHHILWQLFVTVLFVWAGALQAWPGKLALAVSFVSWVALWRAYWGASVAEGVVEGALQQGLGAEYREHLLPEVSVKFAPAVDWRQILRPFPMRHPEVERLKDITFARAAGLNLKLDVYRHRSRPTNCPTLLQIHGGGWVVGSKDQQGIPLMLHLAARGWACVTVNYRLSPHATFPDHLIDCKRALQWVREHGEAYGANPDFVVVTGGSAGGHLAALMALTANDPEYQPGFADVDTRLDGCVAFYGVYDFADRHGLWHHDALEKLLERQVMKAGKHEARDAYEKASPMVRVHPAAPPFFVIHGDADTLVPIEEARRFAAALRAVSQSPVVYAEIPGAQHAFEIFPSLRSLLVIHGVERFLAYVYSRYLMHRAQPAEAAPQLVASAS
jgi:acetyl esterase/lipase